MNQTAHICCVVGARPNFMKMAPVLRQLQNYPQFRVTLVHTEQHYDPAMSANFFQQLGVREPDHRLNVGSASHATQTARAMERLEAVFVEDRHDLVVVAGDINSTLAAALTAAKLNIAVAHIEAGLRSYDRAMPEEINRVLVDQIASLLYTTERSARDNLLREGIADDRIAFVGNLMIDTLISALDRAVPAASVVGPDNAARILGGYAVLTLHRPSNVDKPPTLRRIMDAIASIAAKLPVVFPVHPRTVKRMADLGERYQGIAGLLMLPPVGYHEMVGLMREARLVLTDSGGIQEETTVLGVPCLTLRENTERPITVSEGTNIVVGTDPARIMAEANAILASTGKRGQVPEGWDGAAAKRLVAHLANWLESRQGEERDERLE